MNTSGKITHTQALNWGKLQTKICILEQLHIKILMNFHEDFKTNAKGWGNVELNLLMEKRETETIDRFAHPNQYQQFICFKPVRWQVQTELEMWFQCQSVVLLSEVERKYLQNVSWVISLAWLFCIPVVQSKLRRLLSNSWKAIWTAVGG